MGGPGALRKKGTKGTGAGSAPAPEPTPDADTVEAHLDTARAALDAALKAHDAMRWVAARGEGGGTEGHTAMRGGAGRAGPGRGGAGRWKRRVWAIAPCGRVALPPFPPAPLPPCPVTVHVDGPVLSSALVPLTVSTHQPMCPSKSTAAELEKRAAAEAESETQTAEREAAAAKISALATEVADLKKENLA